MLVLDLQFCTFIEIKMNVFFNFKNGGTCVNGACQCPIGFAGKKTQLSYYCPSTLEM